MRGIFGRMLVAIARRIGAIDHMKRAGIIDGGYGEPNFIGNSFPNLTNHCTDILLQAEKYFPAAPMGSMLFHNCPHPPLDFDIFHLPLLNSMNVLWGLARILKPTTYLEIGTLVGGSLLAVTKGSEQAVLRCVSIDHSSNVPKIAGANITASGYKGEMEFITAKSGDVSLEEKFDLVYVDGDHTFQGAANDMQHFWHNVKPNGYMAVDNTVNILMPSINKDFYTYVGATKLTNYPVLEAMLEVVSHNRLTNLDSVIYQYPSWNGFGLFHKSADT